jgi:D-galactarolactone cycloisomerase
VSVTGSPVTSATIAPLAIESIETVLVRVPLGRVFRGSHYAMTHRSTVVTRVLTAGGITGEAYAGDEDAGLRDIDSIIHTEIAPRLIGQDAFSVERCWELARPATFDILRERRLGLVACACVDAAIWDAIGKHLGQPLWRLWGGYRQRLPMICIGAYYDSPAPIEEEVELARKRGLAGMKVKVGGMTPEQDATRFRRARQAAGSDFILCADANQGWTPAEALRFARAVQDCELRWFEEPCGWDDDRRAMRDVRFKSGIDICAGQSELSAAGCRALMAEGSIDVCNFDASWSGGPSEWRRAAAVAATFGVAMGHHEEPQLSAHLLAAIPHGTFAECFEPDRDPIWWNLIANRPPLRDGCLELTDRPGLGWELDRDYIEYHRLPAG